MDGDDAYIGTNVEYAPYVELGTGKFLITGKRLKRKASWRGFFSFYFRLGDKACHAFNWIKNGNRGKKLSAGLSNLASTGFPAGKSFFVVITTDL